MYEHDILLHELESRELIVKTDNKKVTFLKGDPLAFFDAAENINLFLRKQNRSSQKVIKTFGMFRIIKYDLKDALEDLDTLEKILEIVHEDISSKTKDKDLLLFIHDSSIVGFSL